MDGRARADAFHSQDNRPHPTEAGRADGLQPRTLEVLRNIGGLPVPEGKSGLAKRMVSQGVRYVPAPPFLLGMS